MSRPSVFLLVPVLAHLGSGLQFYLPVNSVKCLREDVHTNVLVAGEYELREEPRTTTHLKITDSLGSILYTKQNATQGKFSFTTEQKDMFEICFFSISPKGSRRVEDQLVTLNMKHGVEGKDDKGTDQLEKLTPLEAKLRQIERLSLSIADGYVYVKRREKGMRRTNASTNTRVLFLSITSICCLSALAIWQVFYLRHFFKTRKLIE